MGGEGASQSPGPVGTQFLAQFLGNLSPQH